MGLYSMDDFGVVIRWIERIALKLLSSLLVYSQSACWLIKANFPTRGILIIFIFFSSLFFFFSIRIVSHILLLQS